MSKGNVISVEAGKTVPFANNMDYCVGTGRMGLALHKAYQEQLRQVQETIGFRHIRGHGLFCDDMAICQRCTDKSGKQTFEYNYTYLDMVMDSYRELGIRPFLELGFMPAAMASGDQTVFYWKGNVTPPANYSDWSGMIKALLHHLIVRYGRDEVVQWPIEVWNEPNLSNFWKDADMGEYFRLYECSVRAVKEVEPGFKVGGPAICGVNDEVWMRDFLEFVRENKVPLDFVTRHHYTIGLPEKDGHYAYAKLHDFDESFELLERSRTIVDSFDEFRGMDIHITEFNTAYVPDCPLHDTNLNAAFIAAMLSRLGDCHASFSYWTFGDIFEEKGVPFTPFHGGFGLLANGGIPKPTFWTFAFYKKLDGDCVHRSRDAVITRAKDGAYRGILWNPDTAFEGSILSIDILLPVAAGEYCLVTRTVDEECCNPLKLWHDLGEPSSLSTEQIELLKEHAVPSVASSLLHDENGKCELQFSLKPNAVVFFELRQRERKSDRGYSYERVTRRER